MVITWYESDPRSRKAGVEHAVEDNENEMTNQHYATEIQKVWRGKKKRLFGSFFFLSCMLAN